MGVRGGAVFHMRSISAGVRAQAWFSRSLRVRFRFTVAAVRARAGVRASERQCVERGAWGLVSGSFLPRMRFTSATKVSESRSVAAKSLMLGFSMAYSTRS